MKDLRTHDYDREDSRVERILLTLSKVSLAMQHARTTKNLYEIFGEQIRKIGFEATILLLEDSGKHLFVEYQSRSKEDIDASSKRLGFSIQDYRVPIRENGLLARVIHEREVVCLDSRAEVLVEIFPKSIRRLVKKLVSKGKPMQTIIAPLYFEDRTLGVIGVSGADLRREDRPAISIFASQVSTILTTAQAHNILQERDQQLRIFRRFHEDSDQGFGIGTLDGKINYVNPALARILQVDKPDHLIGKSFIDVYSEELKEQIRDEIIPTVMSTGNWEGQLSMVRSDGSRVATYENFSLIRDENGEARYLADVISDITEQIRVKNVDDALRDLVLTLNEKNDLEDVLDHCLQTALKIAGMDVGGIYRVDDETGDFHLMCSHGLSRIFIDRTSELSFDSPQARLIQQGHPIYTQHQKLGIRLDENRLEENLKAIAIVPVMHKGKAVACMNIGSKTHEEVPPHSRAALETLASRIGSAIARAKAEDALLRLNQTLEQRVDERTEALRESEERYRTIVESVNDAVVRLNKLGVIIDINDKVTEVFGYTREDAIGKSFAMLGVFGPRDLTEVLMRFGKAVRGDVSAILEWKIRHKNGTRIPIEASASLVKKDGKIDGVVAIVRDISERKQIDEERSHSFRLLQGLSEAGPALQRVESPEAAYKAIGKQLVEMGLDVTIFSLEPNGTHLGVAYHTLDSRLIRAAEKLTSLRAENYRFAIEEDGLFHRIITKGETVFSFSDTSPVEEVLPPSVRPLASQLLTLINVDQSILAPLSVSGQGKGLLVVTGPELRESDIPAITAFANQAAIAIEKTQLNLEKNKLAEFNEDIIQSMTEGIVVQNVDGIITFANPAAALILGYGAGELTGRHWTEIVSLKDHPTVQAADQRRIDGYSDRYEVDVLCRHGALRTVLVSGSPSFDSAGVFGGTMAVFTDITERKQAELEIQKNLTRLSGLHEIDRAITSKLGLKEVLDVVVKGLSSVIESDSLSIQLLEADALEIVASDGFDDLDGLTGLRFPLELKFPNIKVLQQKSALAYADITEEFPHFQDESDYFYSGEIRSWLGIPLLVEDEVVGVVTFDRHEVKRFNEDEIEIATTFATQAAIAVQNARLDKDLRDTESNYRNIFEGIQDAIFVEALDGTILDVNREACELFGYSKDEFLQLNARDLVPPEYPVVIPGNNGNTELGQPPIETMNLTADGQLIPVEITVRTQDIGGENRQLVVVRDIRERKQAEDQIRRHIDRLEALRQIDLAIIGLTDLDQTLDICLEQIRSQLEIDAVCILLFNPVNEHLEYAASSGFRTSALQHTSIRIGEGYAGKAAFERDHLFMTDLVLPNNQFSVSPEFRNEGFSSYYAVPLMVRGEVTGVVEIFHRAHMEPDPEWISFLDMLTTQIAIAIDNASLFTGLQNYSEELEDAVRDATGELRYAKERLEVILNNSPDVVLLLSTDGTIERANDAIEELFGYVPGSIEGKGLTDLLAAEADSHTSHELRNFSSIEHPLRIEVEARRQDKTSFDADLHLTPIMHDAEVSAIVCTLRDVTAWKSLERMKDAFVSNVSHELRTPITGLRLNHGLLARDPSQLEKYLDRMDREITRLNELIEDLLRLSRLDQGNVELSLEDVNLNKLVEQVVTDREILAQEHQLMLTRTKDPQAPSVYADSNLLGQVLSVLVVNAINYTPAGGNIEVGVVDKMDNGVHLAGFRVKDDGLGISAQDLPNLFERFYRGQVGRESGAPGTGLGLAIANEIVARHNGEIEVDSLGVPGEGTTFTVWIPAIKESSIEQGEMQNG